MSGLTIGALTLTPTFDPAVKAYTAATSNNTNKITATASAGIDITVKVNGTVISNASSAAWNAGDNTVLIELTDTASGQTAAYTVTVTKS